MTSGVKFGPERAIATSFTGASVGTRRVPRGGGLTAKEQPPAPSEETAERLYRSKSDGNGRRPGTATGGRHGPFRALGAPARSPGAARAPASPESGSHRLPPTAPGHDHRRHAGRALVPGRRRRGLGPAGARRRRPVPADAPSRPWSPPSRAWPAGCRGGERCACSRPRRCGPTEHRAPTPPRLAPASDGATGRRPGRAGAPAARRPASHAPGVRYAAPGRTSGRARRHHPPHRTPERPGRRTEACSGVICPASMPLTFFQKFAPLPPCVRATPQDASLCFSQPSAASLTTYPPPAPGPLRFRPVHRPPRGRFA